jgi:transposase
MVTSVTEPQWVGIDVSQAWLDIVLRPAGTYWRLSNQVSGWAEVVTHLQALDIKLVVLESTGGMERGIVQVLQQQAIPVQYKLFCLSPSDRKLADACNAAEHSWHSLTRDEVRLWLILDLGHNPHKLV